MYLFYSTASYSLLNRYTVGGSIRFDGSDLFGVDKKYRYLPLIFCQCLVASCHKNRLCSKCQVGG